MWKKGGKLSIWKNKCYIFAIACVDRQVYWSYQRRSSSSVKMIICLIVVILTDRSYYCGKLPDVPCHNNRVCTNNKFHIVSSACSLPPLLAYILSSHSTFSIMRQTQHEVYSKQFDDSADYGVVKRLWKKIVMISIWNASNVAHIKGVYLLSLMSH